MAGAFVCIDVWTVHAITSVGNTSITEDSRAAFLGFALVPFPVSGSDQ